MDSKFYHWEADDSLVLRVFLQPAASQNKVVGVHANALKIRLTAAPVAGEANKHLIKYLAKMFAVPQKQVELQKGHSNRSKIIRISQPGTLPAFILPNKTV